MMFKLLFLRITNNHYILQIAWGDSDCSLVSSDQHHKTTQLSLELSRYAECIDTILHNSNGHGF